LDQDKILRAYTRLKGIKDNLPEKTSIRVHHVTDYHDIINSLEKELDLSLSEFRIPETEIFETQLTIKVCMKSFFMSKLDALLSYFELRFLSAEEPEIGFNPPE